MPPDGPSGSRWRSSAARSRATGRLRIRRPRCTRPTSRGSAIRGGVLGQERTRLAQAVDASGGKVVSQRRPTDAEWRDLRFAWAAVGAVKSNAILLVRDEAAVGIGAGQMSRVDASFLAVHKARQ